MSENCSSYVLAAQVNTTKYFNSRQAIKNTVYNMLNEGLIQGISRIELLGNEQKYIWQGFTKQYIRTNESPPRDRLQD